MKIHHIGYLVDDIEAAASEFEKLGYSKTDEIVEDAARKIYILFLGNGAYTIELVQPADAASPVYKLRKKHRNSPYHICYETDDLPKTIEQMVNFHHYILLQPPEKAPAIVGSTVAFLVSREMGMIELLCKEF